jgi:hypothetical protein
MGRLPQHARNVALVLNIETGLVSPQFHVKFDPSFHTVKQSPEMTSSWQIKAGFVAQREPTPEPTKTNLNAISRPSEGAPIGAPPEPTLKRPRTEDPNVPNKIVRFNRRPPSEEESNKSELNNVLQHRDSSQDTLDPQDKQPQIAPVKKTIRIAQMAHKTVRLCISISTSSCR